MGRWLRRGRDTADPSSQVSFAPPPEDSGDVGLVPGSVVATYSEALLGWAAAVIVHVEQAGTFGKSVSLLELDWSGSEAPSLADAAAASPLRLTHHNWTGKLSYTKHDIHLPRNYEVVGRIAVPDLAPANSWTPRWTVGQQLASQRRWDGGETGPDPRRITCTASELPSFPSSPDVWKLKVVDIDSLDCGDVTARFPNLSELSLDGRLGELVNAEALNALTGLKLLSISNVFGMKSSDVYRYEPTTRLDALYLNNIPDEYAAATKRFWRGQAVFGTTLEVLGARKPEWVAENRSNPFRDWDMRSHISRPRIAKVTALFKSTRAEVLDVLSAGKVEPDRLRQIGVAYGEALNVIDGTRSPFIETEEREDLFAALEQIVSEADLTPAKQKSAVAALFDGVENVRTW